MVKGDVKKQEALFFVVVSVFISTLSLKAETAGWDPFWLTPKY